MSKIVLPTMTKPSHWLGFVLVLLVCFAFAAISFVYIPLLGVVFVVLPNILSFVCVFLYFKNAGRS